MRTELRTVTLAAFVLCLLAGFSWFAPPPNDNFANAVVVDQANFTHSFNTVDATSEQYEITNNALISDDEQSVWYRYTPANSGYMTVSLSNASTASGFGMVWTTGLTSGVIRNLGVNGTIASAPVSAGTTQYFRVSGEAYNSVAQGKQLNPGTGNFNLTGPVALPVEFLFVDAFADGDDVLMRWSTATELDNAGFAVELAGSGEDFREVTFIEGAGTTVEQQDYAYRLSDLTPDVYRLRLKQIDFDGTTDYSDVVEATVEVPGTHVLEAAYPNPFNPQATFSVVVAETQPVRVELYDLSGRLVETLFAGELQANQAERFTIDGSSLSSGTYLYRLTGATFTEAKRVTLAK